MANPPLVYSIRQQLNRLTAAPDKFKLHSFFTMLVDRIEDLQMEVADLKEKNKRANAGGTKQPAANATGESNNAKIKVV